MLIANLNTRFRINTQQLIDFFQCNNQIVEFHANYKPFYFNSGNICVRSVMRYGSGKLLALQTKTDLVYLPMRIAFRLLHLQKMLRNNVLIFINMQLGIKANPLVM